MPASRSNATAKAAREDERATPTTQRNRRTLSRRKASGSAKSAEGEVEMGIRDESEQQERERKKAAAAEARAAKREAEKQARKERLRKQAEEDLEAAYEKYKPRRVMYVKNGAGPMYKTNFKKAYVWDQDNTCWVVGKLQGKKGDVACEYKYSKGAREYGN
ncbi:hypothetical protein FA13DRAFT_1714927 [Coprinellus micaceus]|uniref:Uncharacterized protein n=1 Tax=Coprinellus micaceus TaxID=71717 RepID=A0A4Y7SQR5_COPMI|nr:hypothetical protein FA13DRAFT_1714927 [Coprinellus micaceus]